MGMSNLALCFGAPTTIRRIRYTESTESLCAGSGVVLCRALGRLLRLIGGVERLNLGPLGSELVRVVAKASEQA